MNPLIWQLILQFLLILVAAILSAAEKSLVSLNAAQLKSDAENGDQHAAALSALADEPDRFLSSVEMLSLFAAFLAGAFAAVNLAPRLVKQLSSIAALHSLGLEPLNTIALILVSLILCFFTLSLGVMIPKRIAMEKPFPVANLVIPAAKALTFLLLPLLWLTTVCSSLLLRIFGIRNMEISDNATEDEIRMMLDESEEEGLIESTEGEMIDNIFEFNNIQGYDVMTHRVDVETIDIQDSREKITELIRESGYSRFPVYENDPDNIIGLLYVKDFFLNQDTPVRELLKEPIYVPDTVICDDLFRRMQKERIHFAVVTDEYGAFLGIITLEDLIEEIVGNIYDEYDESEDYIIPNGDGTWLISGRAELKDVEKALDVVLSERENYNTLSGLILSETEEIPRDGSQFTVDVDGLHIEVLRVCDRRVEETRISILPKDEAQNDN